METVKKEEEIIVEENLNKEEEKPFEEEAVLPLPEENIMEKVSTAETSQPQEKNNHRYSKKRSVFLAFLVGVILGVLIMVGIGYFAGKDEGDVRELSPEPTAAAELSPEPTKEEVNFSEYEVQVLNGSGVSGAAAGVKGLISGLSFEDISTGNADSSEETETTVQLKEVVPVSVFEKIKETLTDYEVVKGEVLEEDGDYDVVITVGAKKTS